MDEQQRRQLDRLEGCLMWGVGVPGIVLVVAALMVAIWGSETLSRLDWWLKGGASGVLLVLVGVVVSVVIRKRR